MTDYQRHLVDLRLAEIKAELESIAELRVTGEDPVALEAELLGEQSDLEFEDVADYLRQQG